MLDERLLQIAKLVRKDSFVCDVGTDHAFLPCFLVRENITAHCVACDINELPLKSAAENIARYGFQSKIQTILSNGLSNVPSHLAQDIVIAGMGGELIATILLASNYTRDSTKQFLLQPMTQVPYLRKTLCQNGFSIIKEIPVIMRNHYYTIIQVVYSGAKTTCSELFSVIGKIPEQNTAAALKYCKHEYSKIMLRIKGINSSKKAIETTNLLQLAEEINEVILNVQANQE